MTKTKSLTEGPIFSRLFLFTLPIMATGLLQVFYNMADHIVVGGYSGDSLALAAIGSTGSLTALIVNMLMGLASGSGVIIAQNYGAKDNFNLSRSIHTASAIAIIGGLLLGTIAFIFAEDLLVLMKTSDNLLSRATAYFKIICIGIPASTTFNFGASILRSVGNSKIQLYILSCTGIINVILNFFFVLTFDMAAEGVALATIISQYISAIAVVIILCNWKEPAAKLSLNKISIHLPSLKRILRIALPTCLHSSLFAMSNIFIQVGANNLNSDLAIEGKTIASNIDNFVYTAINSYSHSTTTFVAQNYGAKRKERIKKSIVMSAIQVTMVGVILGQLLLLFGEELASLFILPGNSHKQEIIEYSMQVMRLILSIYFMCGIMDMLSGALRGLGNSILPMIIGLIGVCGIRFIWIFCFFPMEPFFNLTGLYLSYPITWTFCIAALLIALLFVWRNKFKSKTDLELKSAGALK